MNTYFDVKVFRNHVLDGTACGIESEDVVEMLAGTNADVANFLWTLANERHDGPVVHEEICEGELIRYEIGESADFVSA